MGLTIHYTLAVRHQLQDADAGELVAQARSFARAAEADSVSRRFTTVLGTQFPGPGTILIDETLHFARQEYSSSK